MSSLDSREVPLALADCSFDELVPANRKGSASIHNNNNNAVGSAGPSPAATFSLREPGAQLPSSTSNLWDRMPPSHAASLIYAPSSTLIVARAIHHDARTGPVLHLTFTSLLASSSSTSGARVDEEGQRGGASIADASLRILLPAPAVDSIGLIIHPDQSQTRSEARVLHVFILTHGAQLFQLSIPLTSAALAHGINVRNIQRRTQALDFITPASGWSPTASSGSGLGASAAGVAMSLVMGAKQHQRGKTATQVLFVHSGLMLIACEDGTLVKMEKKEGSRGSWDETFLKPTSFFNTLARLLPRSASAAPHQRSGSTSTGTQLPEPTSSFEPTQILALDAFADQASYSLAFAVSRDRKMRIWGLSTEDCLHTVELPRKRPDLTSVEASFGARAIARRALGLRSAEAGAMVAREGSAAPSSVAPSATGTGGHGTKAPSEYSTATAAFQAGAVFGGIGSSASAEEGGGSSGGASFPRILVEQAPEGSTFTLVALVFVPVPATPTQARAESFFMLYGIQLCPASARGGDEGVTEAVQAVTPLWSCAAADEGEDVAAGMVSAPALRAVKLRSYFVDADSGANVAESDAQRQGWTLWTAWNTLAGPEVRKTTIRLDVNGKPLPAVERSSAAPALTQEETAAPIWTAISAFPCPSARSSSCNARARYSPLHGLHFTQDLARALEHESSSVADFFMGRLFEPGRFDAGSLERAADWYEESNQRALAGRNVDRDATFEGYGSVGAGDRTLNSAIGPTRDGARSGVNPIMTRLLSLIGAHLRPQRDAATGALRHGDFESALVREWVKYVDRAEKEEDAARYVLGFVGPVVCASDDNTDKADVTARLDMDEDGDGANGEVGHDWSDEGNDPVIVIANNRLGLPISELPAETLLRIAREAAREDLADFVQVPEEDVAGGDGRFARRFKPEALQSLATCLSSVDIIRPSEVQERENRASRVQRARLLADMVALGLSIPRALAESTADSVRTVLSLGPRSDNEGVLHDAIQEAWLGACELYYMDSIIDAEEEVHNGQDAQDEELDPEAEAHLAKRQSEIKEEISQQVVAWFESQLFLNEANADGEAAGLDNEKASVMEQALWAWVDLLCGPTRDSPGLASPPGDGSAPVTASLFGAVLVADGALRALLARRRLGHALLALLLSLQRSEVFNPEFSAVDGGDDDPFATEYEEETGAIPSLPLLLSTTLAALQRIEGLYRLASLNASPEVDPKTLLVAAEIDLPPHLDQLREDEQSEGDRIEDLSFDRTVRGMKALTVRPNRAAEQAGNGPRPASVRNLFHYAVQRQILGAGFGEGRPVGSEADLADTDGEADDHNAGELKADVQQRGGAAALELTGRISMAARGLLSCTGLLGLHLPSAVWTALDNRSEGDRQMPTDTGVEDASGPRLEHPQAQLARSIFNAGFPSAVLRYLACFTEADSPASAYLTARALIALGQYEAAEDHIQVVARALQRAAEERQNAQKHRDLQAELRHQARSKRLSPDDWEHADRLSDAEGGIEPDIEEENMQTDEVEDEVDLVVDHSQESVALLRILPANISTAIESHPYIPSVAIELFYRHFVDIWVDVEAPEQLIKACTAALQANSVIEAVVLDEEREGLYADAAGIESPILHNVNTLWSHLFHAQMRLGRFSDAYVTLVRTPLRDMQVECLRSLVGVMCEQGQSPVLLGFSFPGLQRDVERELSFKARNSHAMAYPNYFNILHKYHVFRGDMKNAAASMYQLAQAYGLLHRSGGLFSADADPAENFLELAKLQAQSYLAALNDLALCHPREAYFSDGSPSSANVAEREEPHVDPDVDNDLQNAGEGQKDAFPADRTDADGYAASTAKRRRLTTYIPEHMYHEERRAIRMVHVEDIRREYHLVLARLELVRFFPEAANPSFVLGAANAVSLFVGNRQFDSAFSIARELDVDMTIIFQRLTTICVALSDNLANRRAEAAAMTAASKNGSAADDGGSDDDALKRRLDSVYDAEENRLEPEVDFLVHSEWSMNWDGPAADRAWDYLRIHLEMSDSASSGWRYRQAVLDRCLALGAKVSVPAWLLEWFQAHKSDSLMRSYIQAGRIDDALREGLRIANQISQIDGPSATFIPYSLLDSALLLAEDPEERARRAASPSILQTRDLASELRLAVRRRFEVLGKAEKSWVRDAQRREREQSRTDKLSATVVLGRKKSGPQSLRETEAASSTFQEDEWSGSEEGDVEME
ncbi:hypothetical protein A4X13_0g1257 [Tilletia indica]|uniref:Nuclear pore complex protein Nup160 n=1 Tax=Tilletia indica TaxID=43049 RepID=A0A177TVU8_9BASI|nr:hypothetical protein A4X13_0g1257 [Tilletia indica]